MGKPKKETKELKNETTGKYIGAKWNGAELFSSEFGKLIKGQIYSLTEERAKASDGFQPVYEGENSKGGN